MTKIKKENEKVYKVKDSLPYLLELTENEDGYKWDMKYETSMISQMAVFAYVADLYKKIAENRLIENEAFVKDNPLWQKKGLSLPCSKTEFTKYVNFQKELHMYINEMMPHIIKKIKESQPSTESKIKIIKK